MTPEGKVKERVKAILKKYRATCYWHMPVQNGMGAPSLDFVGCSMGRYFAIETKAPGKALTPRQKLTTKEIEQAGGVVFVIDGTNGDGVHSLEVLELWVSKNGTHCATGC